MVAMLLMAGASANAATLYTCEDPNPKDPSKSQIAIVIVDKSGQAIGMDAWSHDAKNPDNMWRASVRKNDATTLDVSWRTDPQKTSGMTSFQAITIKLKIRKSDMTYFLSLSGTEVVTKNLRGRCETETVKDFVK